MLPLTLCKLAALHYLLLCCVCMGLLLAPAKPVRECFLLPCAIRESQSTPKPYGWEQRSPKWAESTRVWMEGGRPQDWIGRFSLPKALTQRRMGRTKLRGTWTKEAPRHSFSFTLKKQNPSKGTRNNGRAGFLTEEEDTWCGRETGELSPGFHSELSEISCTNTVPNFLLEVRIPFP